MFVNFIFVPVKAIVNFQQPKFLMSHYPSEIILKCLVLKRQLAFGVIEAGFTDVSVWIEIGNCVRIPKKKSLCIQAIAKAVSLFNVCLLAIYLSIC